MGFYGRWIFPRLVDGSLSREEISEQRRKVLSDVAGDVVEIGFGTGLNLPHYSPRVQRLTAVDPNPGMKTLARRRIAESPIPVEQVTIRGERLPVEDARFDAAVSTFTLCSIPDAVKALKEIHRALKPGGRLFFVEHGLSPESNVAKWQHRLTPLQRLLADGCHLDRDIRRLVETSGFVIESLENEYLSGSPRMMGYLYRGIAAK